MNGAINAAICWLMFHGAVQIGMWGHDGIALDTLLTGVVLPALTVVIGTMFVGRDLAAGRTAHLEWRREDRRLLRVFPHGVIARAVIFGLLFSTLSVPVTLGWLVRHGVEAMSFDRFFVFKVSFACSLGIVVTPINALWALSAQANATSR